MGRPNTQPLKTTNPHHVLLTGHFHPAAGNAPTGLVGDGFASIARTGAGEFTLTLTDKFYGIEYVSAHLGMSAATDSVVQVGDIDASAKTIKLHTLTAGAAADIAANSNNTVFVSVVATQSDLG